MRGNLVFIRFPLKKGGGTTFERLKHGAVVKVTDVHPEGKMNVSSRTTVDRSLESKEVKMEETC